jgi:hypothetical protein
MFEQIRMGGGGGSLITLNQILLDAYAACEGDSSAVQIDTGFPHLDIVFSWFPWVLGQMLGWLSTVPSCNYLCFSFSPPYVNFKVKFS